MSREVYSDDSIRKSNKSTLKIILGTAAVFVLAMLALVISAVDLSYKHFEYPKAAKRYKDSGLPWTSADLTGKAIPDAQNGYSKLVALLDELKRKTKLKAPVVKALMTPSDYSVVAEYLSERNSMLDKSYSIAKMDFSWDKNWDEGALLLFPELAGIKNLVKDLVLRAEYRAARRDLDGAVSDLKAASGIAHGTSAGPTLINGLAAIACRSIIFRGLQRSASYHLNDAEALSKLQSSIANLSVSPDLYYHFKGEAFMGVTSLRNFRWKMILDSNYGETEPVKAEKLRAEGDVRGLAAKSFAVPYLNAWSEVAEEVKTKGNSPQVMMEITDKMDSIGQKEKGVSGAFSRIMFPVFSQAGVAYAKTEADYLTAKWGMQAAINRAQGMPASALKLDNDPFGSGPLKLVIDESRILVWSLGLNRKDDSALSLQEARAHYQKSRTPAAKPPTLNEVDLVFELPYRVYSE